MAIIPFTAAYVEGGGTTSMRHYPIYNSEVFKIGAPLTINGNAVDEIDTDDVTLVVGIAAAASQSAFGFDAGDSPTTVTGRVDSVPVAVAGRDVVFYGQLSNGTTSLVVPDGANVGVSYGVIKQADGTWTVDEADTTNKLVTVIGFLPQGPSCADPFGIVFFKVLQSALYA